MVWYSANTVNCLILLSKHSPQIFIGEILRMLRCQADLGVSTELRFYLHWLVFMITFCCTDYIRKDMAYKIHFRCCLLSCFLSPSQLKGVMIFEKVSKEAIYKRERRKNGGQSGRLPAETSWKAMEGGDFSLLVGNRAPSLHPSSSALPP